MSLEAKLYARISEVADNVYPLEAPLDYSVPVVVYNRIGTTPTPSLDNDNDTAFIKFQVDVYDPDHSACKTLARTIRQHLRQWVDEDEDVQACVWIEELESIDKTTKVPLYRTMLHFRVFAAV